jgi:hypothetical protein
MSSKLFRVAAVACCLSALPAQAAPLVASLPLNAVPLRVTTLQLGQPQSALKIDLPGRSLTFATKTLSPQSGMTGVRGATPDGENRVQAFLWNGKVLSGDVYANDGRYTLVSYLGRDFWVRDADLAQMAVRDNSGDALPRPATISSVKSSAPIAAPQPDGNYRIDLLILYTPAYQQVTQRTAAAINAEAQRLIFIANTYFENSAMPIRYRLVGVSAFNATSEQQDCYANVEAMATDSTARSLRDSSGADMVVLFRTDGGNDGTGGLGSVFNGGEQSYPPANVDPERDAYSCIQAAPATIGGDARPLDLEHVFAHELGHGLGGGHQYMGPKSVLGNYWRPYAHAWRCGGIATEGGPLLDDAPGLYQTIMTGNTSASVGVITIHCLINSFGIQVCDVPLISGTPAPVVGRPKGDFFSDPAAVRGGLGCGVMLVQPPLGEALQADNRRSITEAAPYVAAYRATVVP